MANVNSAEQIVIGGPNAALEQAVANAKAAGARRAIPLDVAGAFHTEAMRPAQAGLERALSGAALARASAPVVANTTALPIDEPEALREELAAQLCGCVHWSRSVEYMASAGVARFVEFGPGKTLAGLVKRIVPGASALAVPDLDAIGAL